MHQQRQGTQIRPVTEIASGTAANPELADNSAEFVERIRAGDAFAWRELIDRYEPLLRQIARQYRLSSQEIEDAVQTTWLRCLEHINQLAHADRLLSLIHI